MQNFLFVILLGLFAISSGYRMNFRSSALRKIDSKNIILNHPNFVLKSNSIITTMALRAKDPKTNVDNSSNPSGPEPKYVIAALVFIAACIFDKMVMHGGF